MEGNLRGKIHYYSVNAQSVSQVINSSIVLACFLERNVIDGHVRGYARVQYLGLEDQPQLHPLARCDQVQNLSSPDVARAAGDGGEIVQILLAFEPENRIEEDVIYYIPYTATI